MQKVIKERMKAHGVVKHAEEEHEAAEGAATNVVDFMSLLRQSIDRNKRTPAKKSIPGAVKTPARKVAGKKMAAAKSTAKKTPAKASRRKSA